MFMLCGYFLIVITTTKPFRRSGATNNGQHPELNISTKRNLSGQGQNKKKLPQATTWFNLIHCLCNQLPNGLLKVRSLVSVIFGWNIFRPFGFNTMEVSLLTSKASQACLLRLNLLKGFIWFNNFFVTELMPSFVTQRFDNSDYFYSDLYFCRDEGWERKR